MDNYNKIKHKVENGVNEFLMKTFIKRNVEEMFNDFVSENDFEDRNDLEFMRVIFNSILKDEVGYEDNRNKIKTMIMIKISFNSHKSFSF